jgi:SAM-dependent methyltransferase
VRTLDNDAILVRRMAANAASLWSCDIDVQEGDAFATRWESGSLDAMHARFLAAPTGRLDDLVAEMLRVLRPLGLLMLQEPDANSWHVPNAGRAWLRLRELIRQGFASRGGNFDAGRDLVPALQRHGVEGVRSRHVSHAIPGDHPYAALPLAFARQMRRFWIDERLVGEDELESLLASVQDALARGGAAHTFTLVQAWGRAPAIRASSRNPQ